LRRERAGAAIFLATGRLRALPLLLRLFHEPPSPCESPCNARRRCGMAICSRPSAPVAFRTGEAARRDADERRRRNRWRAASRSEGSKRAAAAAAGCGARLPDDRGLEDRRTGLGRGLFRAARSPSFRVTRSEGSSGCCARER
jgi:hypothetical protein